MNKIIENVPRRAGHKIGNTFVHVVRYADDAVLIANSKNDLQRLLHSFNNQAKKLNVLINTRGTKWV